MLLSHETHIYGSGTYFTPESCKAYQYTKQDSSGIVTLMENLSALEVVCHRILEIYSGHTNIPGSLACISRAWKLLCSRFKESILEDSIILRIDVHWSHHDNLCDIIEEWQLMRFGIILKLDAVALETRCCFRAE